MLSKEVQVSIFGTLSDRGIYSGYVTLEDNRRRSAYVVSKKPVFDSFTGIVTALVTLRGAKEEKLVVTPISEIIYEPELKRRLESLKNVRIEKISCLYEKSCGAVILHKNPNGTISVLLVKNHNSRYWSFPKGHVELWENEKETAVREIKEETDLDVEILDGFREISDYCPFGKIRKRVVFFLAVADSDRVRIQESEIDSFTWVGLSDVRNVCTYENDLRVIEKVKRYCTEHMA